MEIRLPPLVARLLTHLPDPAEVWLVGGAVRDAVLGREVRDVDLALPSGAMATGRALARALAAAFVPLDESRGCARLVLRDSGGVIDLADFRAPTLEEDLRARDFTVNALAVPLAPPHVVLDPTGGLADLEARRLRCPAPEVLDDDPLRGLRAVRFQGQLGFAIEPETRRWIRARTSSLASVARERIRDELLPALASPDPAGVAYELHALGLFDVLFPHRGGLDLDPLRGWIRTEETLLEGGDPAMRSMRERIDRPLPEAGTHRALLRLACLLGVPDPEGFRALLARLRLGSGTVGWGARLTGGVFWLEGTGSALEPLRIYRFYRAAGDAGPEAALLAYSRDTISGETLDALLRAWFERRDELVDPPALVTGDDLLATGLEPGPRIGELLERIREAQVEGRVKTKRDALELVAP